MRLFVSAVASGRSTFFYCLKRIKKLSTKYNMGHKKLSSFALISIEYDLSHPDSVDIENFIENFKLYSNKCRKILL